jgi:hypothetical protein
LLNSFYQHREVLCNQPVAHLAGEVHYPRWDTKRGSFTNSVGLYTQLSAHSYTVTPLITTEFSAGNAGLSASLGAEIHNSYEAPIHHPKSISPVGHLEFKLLPLADGDISAGCILQKGKPTEVFFTKKIAEHVKISGSINSAGKPGAFLEIF